MENSFESLWKQLMGEGYTPPSRARRSWYRFCAAFKWSSIRYRLKRTFLYPVQRAKRGWSTYDSWGFDDYISGVISSFLAHHEANLQGHPVYVCAQSGAECEKEDFECCSAAWAKILSRMRFGFEGWATRHDTPMAYDPDAEKFLKEDLDVSLQLFATHFTSLWD